MLRSCYETDVRFFSDSDQLVTIRWYFTKRPMLPLKRAWGNRYWHADAGEWLGPLGEVSGAPRPWRNGQAPIQAGVMGAPHYCGTPDQWAGSCSIANAHMADALGRDPCCRPPPPLPIQLGLTAALGAVGSTLADLSLDLGEASRVSGRGAARPLLAALASVMLSPRSPGSLDGGLPLISALLTVPRATGHASPVLATRHGLLSSSSSLHGQAVTLVLLGDLAAVCQSHGALAPSLAEAVGLSATAAGPGELEPLLSAKEGLHLTSAAVGRLTTDLSVILATLVALEATGRLSAGLSALADLTAIYVRAHVWAATLALLETLQATPHAPGRIAVLDQLIEALKAAAHAKGVLLTTEQLTEAVLGALKAPGQEVPVGGTKAKVTASFAAFQLVTPMGGCGPLPASLVARFSGGTGAVASLSGHQATLTYSGGPLGWTGTFVVGATTWSVNMPCVGGSYTCQVSAGLVIAGGMLSGATGATPSLSGTLTVTAGGSGSVTVSITRT